jgi:uncharacterized integral membrane protein (TIGR00697 family)
VRTYGILESLVVHLARFKYFDIFLNAFVTILLISNLIAQKIVVVGPFWPFHETFYVSGAQALFPLTYIFGDVFTEVYGYTASKRAIWTGFFASILMAACSALAVWLPPAPVWADKQPAFEMFFGAVPRIVFASLAAYWCGEFANSFVMAKMKVMTNGKFLWMRTIGSTVVGQLIDTVVVIVIIFAGKESMETMIKLIIGGYGTKVIYEAAMTPVTYLAVNALKRAEGVDVYDRHTDFNPFSTNSVKPDLKAD